MAFELPKLDYAYTALEPHIDAKTMEQRNCFLGCKLSLSG